MQAFGLFRLCEECGEPVKFIDVCEELGYNPGIDGHFFTSSDAAYAALCMLMDKSKKYSGFYEDVEVYEFCIFN